MLEARGEHGYSIFMYAFSYAARTWNKDVNKNNKKMINRRKKLILKDLFPVLEFIENRIMELHPQDGTRKICQLYSRKRFYDRTSINTSFRKKFQKVLKH